MIRKYLESRRGMVYLYLCFLFVFPAVHYLYGLAPVPTAYSLLIITFLLLVFTAADYVGYRARMRYLQDINRHLSSDKLIALKAGDAIEEEYLAMVSSLYDIVKSQLETVEKLHTEQVEYYTMWVHQIKTPISAMRLALQSMEASEHLSLLNQELFKIEQYVELALQYTKLKELSSDLVIREYALEEIVNQSVKKYAPLFIYKKLSVTIDDFHPLSIRTASGCRSFSSSCCPML